MSSKLERMGAVAALLGAGAALVPADPASAHGPIAATPAGVGSASALHDSAGRHRYVAVCTWGADDVTGWFWMANGDPFVGFNPQTNVCFYWDTPSSVVSFYACDHKGCSPPTYV